MIARRDPAGLARICIVALRIYAAVAVLAAVGGMLQVTAVGDYPSDTSVDPMESLPGAEVADLVGGLGAVLQLIALLITGFLVLRWVFRTNANAHSLAEGMTSSPTWAVAWFFIPVASLWKPYESIRETWQVSIQPSGWRAAQTPSVLRWWWGFWLAGAVLGGLTLPMTFRATENVGEFTMLTYATVVGYLLDVPTAMLLIRVIRGLTGAQVQTLNTESFS